MKTSACQVEVFCCQQVGHEGACSPEIFPQRPIVIVIGIMQPSGTEVTTVPLDPDFLRSVGAL